MYTEALHLREEIKEKGQTISLLEQELADTQEKGFQNFDRYFYLYRKFVVLIVRNLVPTTVVYLFTASRKLRWTFFL